MGSVAAAAERGTHRLVGIVGRLVVNAAGRPVVCVQLLTFGQEILVILDWLVTASAHLPAGHLIRMHLLWHQAGLAAFH